MNGSGKKQQLGRLAIAVSVALIAGCKPVANNQSIEVYQGDLAAITLTATDKENDPLTYRIVDDPDNGMVSGTAPNLSYTPRLNFLGDDSFTFVANDGTGDSSPATINIKVKPGSADDQDGDGVNNTEDTFPNDGTEFLDSDHDGIGNYKDADEDNDGVADVNDAFPLDATKSTLPSMSESEFNDNPQDADLLSAGIPIKVLGVIQAEIDGDMYRFSGKAGQPISALLVKSDPLFAPDVTFLTATGEAMASSSLSLGAYSKSHTLVNVILPSDGTYYLAVTDTHSKGQASFTYDVSLFVDIDADGLGDDIETALGSNMRKLDSENDGISDLIEQLAGSPVQFDVDGDSVPNWLDRESDGDEILDAVEGAGDVDSDSAPNLADEDADGNGLPDAMENSDGRDTDQDGQLDFLDLDDDADGLPDSLDSNRTAKIEYSNELSSSALILDAIQVELGDGWKVNNVVKEAQTVTLLGRGFSSTREANLILVSTSNGSIGVTPVGATNTSLTFAIPSGATDELFVVVGNQRSASLGFERSNASAPVLALPGVKTAMARSTIELHGAGFKAPMNVAVGGVQAIANVVSSTLARVTVPTGTVSDEWVAITADGGSNKIHISVVSGRTTRLTLPSNPGIGFSELRIDAGNNSLVTPDSTGRATVNTDSASISFIDTYWVDSQGQQHIYLQSFSLPGTGIIDINASSTAIARILSSVAGISELNQDQLEDLVALISNLPEVIAFATVINSKLATNRLIFENPDIEYLQSLSAAMKAATTAIYPDGHVSAQSHTPLKGPDITPRTQFDITVAANETNDAIDGDLKVANDSMLFLSTKIIERKSGQEVFPHVTSYFDKNIIGTQSSIYNESEKDDFKQCGFKDCDVEIVTAGINPISATEPSLARILVAKTIIEKMFYPVLETAIGEKFDPSDLTKILINAAPTLVNSVGLTASGGNVDDALKMVIDYVKDDFQTFPAGGPIATALINKFKELFGENIEAYLVERFGKKAVPVLGQISTLIEVAGAANTGVSVAKTVADVTGTPGDLEFKTEWPMQVNGLIPQTMSIDDGPTTLILKGQGLPKAESVTLIDTGLGGQGELTLSVGAVSSDNRAISVLVPGEFLENAVGPVRVVAKNADSEAQSDHDLEIVAELTLSELAPDEGAPGDTIVLLGAGFHPIRSYNRVTFQSASGRVAATVMSADRHELTVRVPSNAVSGNVTVEVENETSNGLPFEVEAGNLSIAFGDNGSINDDTFGLYVDGKLIYAMPSPSRTVGPFQMTLPSGNHAVALRGITAPDAVGTYYIRLSGSIDSVTGDPTSGTDLTAGVEKNWTVVLRSQQASTLMMTTTGLNNAEGFGNQVDSDLGVNLINRFEVPMINWKE